MSETADGDGPTKVAIACQGGGSHTAFTAGVLTEILTSWDDMDCELVGISGTSGGAFNALATWYGLATGDEETAIALLEAIWDDIAATDVSDRATNYWVRTLSRLESMGLPLPAISPYHLPGHLGRDAIVDTLEGNIDFEAIPDLCQRNTPELVVGTVDVNAGVFETFTNEDVTVDAVLASAAVPNLFEAVEVHGHYHWDGLFSQNPPVDDLLAAPVEHKPEELWIVQINPQEFEGEPTTLDVIADRRNELSGNISLNQELKFVERVNEWVEAGYLPTDRFNRTEIHRISMGEQYHCATKVDRDPDFLEELQALGRERASAFLAER